MRTPAGRIALSILSGFMACQAAWKSLPLPPLDSSAHDPVWSIAAHSGGLWATTSEGMFRSRDSGKTWVSARPPAFPRDARFPGTGGRLFSAAGCLFATAATGLFSTCDGGGNWKNLNQEMGSIERLRADGKRLMAGAADSVPQLSDDKGANWRMPPAFFPEYYPGQSNLTSLFKDGARLWAIGRNSYFVSDDSGRSWGQWIIQSTGPSEGGAPGFVDRKLGRLWALGDSGLEIWDDKTGDAFSRSVPADPYLGYFRASSVAVVGKTLFTSGTWGGLVHPAGVFMSTDTGKTWQARSEGIPTYNSYPDGALSYYADSVFALGNVLFARIAGPGGFLFRSTDLGAHWTHSDEGLPGASVYAVHDNRIFAIAGDQENHWSVSDDTGRTWSPWNEDNRGLLVFSSTAAFELRDEGTPVTTDTILVSRDGMKTWQTLHGPWSASSGPYPNGLFASGNFVVAAYQYDLTRFWFSRDEGRTWESDSGFLSDESFHLRAQIGNTSFKTNRDAVIASKDQWQTWTVSLWARPSITALMGFGNALFAITGDSLYLTSDAGTHWGKSDIGKGTAKVFAIDTLGDRLYAATERGLWSTRDGTAWIEAPGSGLYSTGVKAIAASGTNLVLATRQGLFRSPDLGAHWFASEAGPSSVRSLGYRQGRFFADSRESGLWSSSDSGKSWTLRYPSQLPGEFGTYGPHLGMAAGFQSLYLAEGSGQGILQSLDSVGAKWSFGKRSPSDREDVWSLARGANALYASDAEGVYALPSSGGDWSSAKLPGAGPHDFLAGDGQGIAAASSTGIYALPAWSSAWLPAAADLPKEDITALAMGDGRLFAALFTKGLWVDSEFPVGICPRADGPLLSAGPIAALGPDGRGLLRLNLARPARVSLALFGLSGRTLASVDRMATAGSLDLSVEPQELGVAFYRLILDPSDGRGAKGTFEGKLANVR